MTVSCVVGSVSCHTGDLFLRGYLVEQVGQDECITDETGGDLNCADLKRFLLNSDMNLTLNAAFGAAMLPSLPFPLTLHLDPNAID